MTIDTTAPAPAITVSYVAKCVATGAVTGVAATLATVGVIAGHAGLLTLRTAAFAIREGRTTHYRAVKHEVSTIASAAEHAIEASAHGASAWDAARDVLAAGISDEEYAANLKALRDFSF